MKLSYFLACGIAALAAFALGRQTSDDAEKKAGNLNYSFEALSVNAQSDALGVKGKRAEDAGGLGTALANVADDPKASLEAVRIQLEKYYGNLSSAKSAEQASQLSGDLQVRLLTIQVAQNAAILKELRSKKP